MAEDHARSGLFAPICCITRHFTFHFVGVHLFYTLGYCVPGELYRSSRRRQRYTGQDTAPRFDHGG